MKIKIIVSHYHHWFLPLQCAEFYTEVWTWRSNRSLGCQGSLERKCLGDRITFTTMTSDYLLQDLWSFMMASCIGFSKPILGRKAMTNLYNILKSRDITLPTKVRLLKAMVFPVVIRGCESWTLKKAECRRIDAFGLWRRLLRVSGTARRPSQQLEIQLQEIRPECSLEGWMLKLEPQHFGHLLQRTDSLEKILMPGKIKGRRRRGRQRMS